MLEDLLLLVYRHPMACQTLGSALYSLSGFGLVAGAYLQVGKTAASLVVGMAGQPPLAHAAQLLPGIWTWWIPETFEGAAFYTVVLAAGVALAVMAKKVRRQLDAM